ncbi:MAG: serine protease [Verrucomicrobia bacterium]|nr:serine protease [Verrucomicrobiota bacterium]
MVRWPMIPSSRSKPFFLVLSLLGVGLLGLVLGRYLYLTKQKTPSWAVVSHRDIRTPAGNAFPQAPSAPVQPMAAGSGVFDRIAAEVSGVYEQAAPAVVRVHASDGPEQLAGSGFFIDGQGTILTAYAVVGQAEGASVDVNGRSFPAKILGRDPRSGVAVLKIDAGKTPFLDFGEGLRLRPASAVVSVAFPYDLKAEPTFGLVAGFDVKYLTRFFATTHLRANLPIKPGQIGGPLLDSHGKVVGVLMLEIDEGKACYALPIEAAGKVATDIVKYGEPKHGWMGVGVMPDRSRPERGAPVFVDRLYKGTPAERSGLKAGDEVISIGGAFFSVVGEKVPVKVRRDGKEEVFTIIVSARPDSSRMVEPAPLFPNPSGGPANQGMPVKANR